MVFPKFFDKQNFPNDFPYYRKVWIRVVLALLSAALIPLFVIGGGVANYTFEKIQTQTLDALRMQVQAHQQSIDRFLDERENQLKLIADLYPMEDLIAPGRLQFIYNALQRQMPGFSDLGVIDGQGRHRAYIGSYALESQTYDQQDWFRQIADQESHISDVYLGHRQIPHFIIAVRRGQGDRAFFLRATVDSDLFDELVSSGPGELSADSFIVNRAGLFQTRSRSGTGLMAPSGIQPDPGIQGVHVVTNGNAINLMLWQKKVPWLNVVQVTHEEVYGAVERARLAVIITFIVGGLLIAATVLMTTGRLVTRLETKGQDLRKLDQQLRRTSYLAAATELSLCLFEELQVVFLNIDISAQNLAQQHLAQCSADTKDPLCQIAREASRGHKLIDRFVAFLRPQNPVVSEVDINGLLDDLLAFLEKQLQQQSIGIMRDYQVPLSALRSDGGKLRQVFLHLILNAAAAVENGGLIRLLTQAEGDHVIVTISDTGPGIAAVDRERIFEPLFSTKPEGIGLGLSICRSLLDQLGGTITLDSLPGQGAIFTVKIPRRTNLHS